MWNLIERERKLVSIQQRAANDMWLELWCNLDLPLEQVEELLDKINCAVDRLTGREQALDDLCSKLFIDQCRMNGSLSKYRKLSRDLERLEATA